MAKTIKIRCNGPGTHVNEVDLGAVLRPEIFLRGGPEAAKPNLPPRLVLPCQSCAEGTVVIKRAVIEENLPSAPQ